jgi:lysozyme
MNPPMTYSKSGLALTESFEGCKLTSYLDIRGVPTIGWGHTGPDVKVGQVITQAEADALLAEDTQFAVHCVNNAVTVQLTQPEFDALVDFVYNGGCGAFASSTMLRLINEGDAVAAAEQFDVWDWAGGVKVAGLLRRRQAESREFES